MILLADNKDPNQTAEADLGFCCSQMPKHVLAWVGPYICAKSTPYWNFDA